MKQIDSMFFYRLILPCELEKLVLINEDDFWGYSNVTIEYVRNSVAQELRS